MSIINERFSSLAIALAVVLICVFAANAQRFEAQIKIVSASSARIEGKLIGETKDSPNRNWSFPSSIAGAENLGGRIKDFELFDEKGQPIPFSKLAAGEFLTEATAAAFQYQINLDLLPDIKTKAHISWLEEEKGILMVGDLLPHINAGNQVIAAKIRIELPAGWQIITSEKNLGNSTFEVKNVEKAIFAVGKNWRERETANLKIAVADDWQFSDAEAERIATEIIGNYRKLFGDTPTEKTQILLARFPANAKLGRWEAETRGATVTILSSDMPFKTLSLQRLHEQLRHEIFHLWIPNNLALTGNYDWFYEGFTVYEALRTGLAMNQIRFEDFLSTLAEAFDSDDFQMQKTSLPDASKNRWNKANAPIYARGMLIAFLCDAAILKQSKGERSINNVFQEIYRKHRLPNEATDANAAILTVFKNYKELAPLVENYVKGTNKINWETELESFGIEARRENLSTILSVKAKLNKKQKDLLNELGYNNWRKIIQNKNDGN